MLPAAEASRHPPINRATSARRESSRWQSLIAVSSASRAPASPLFHPLKLQHPGVRQGVRRGFNGKSVSAQRREGRPRCEKSRAVSLPILFIPRHVPDHLARAIKALATPALSILLPFPFSLYPRQRLALSLGTFASTSPRLALVCALASFFSPAHKRAALSRYRYLCPAPRTLTPAEFPPSSRLATWPQAFHAREP
jgi:hypothetical protein